MSCGFRSLVNPGARTTEVCATTCGSWYCPPCAANRRRRVRDEIASGQPQSFLTLTWNVGRGLPPDAARRAMGEAWHRFVDRVHRRFPGAPFQYAVVVERTQAGYPHLHVAFRGPFIAQTWISAAWHELCGAPIVWIERARSVDDLAGYLAKYLSKDPTRIGTGKRYWFSQGYRRRDAGGRPAGRPVARWSYVPDHIALVVARLESAGGIPHWFGADRCVLYHGPPDPWATADAPTPTGQPP